MGIRIRHQSFTVLEFQTLRSQRFVGCCENALLASAPASRCCGLLLFLRGMRGLTTRGAEAVIPGEAPLCVRRGYFPAWPPCERVLEFFDFHGIWPRLQAVPGGGLS